MKNLIEKYSLLLLFCLFVNKSAALAQDQIVYNGKAVYDCMFVQIEPSNWQANLYYNKQEKFYQELPNIQKEDIIEQQVGQMSISLKPMEDSVGRYVWAKANPKKLYTRSIPNQKWVLVEEDLPICKWTIVADSSKIIANMMCQKAKSKFRGRDYELWFCPQIPVSQGPWKFNNLPGLAISIKSTDGEVAFLLKENKIMKGSKPIKHIHFKDEIISTKQLKKLQEADRQRIIKLIASFNDKDTKVTVSVSEPADIEK